MKNSLSLSIFFLFITVLLHELHLPFAVDDSSFYVFPLEERSDSFSMNIVLASNQTLSVLLDTGSSLLWAPCSHSFDCIECQGHFNIRQIYQPSVRLGCSSSLCGEIHSSDNEYDTCTIAGCSLNNLVSNGVNACLRQCPSFAYTYADSVITGMLSNDSLLLTHSRTKASIESGISLACVLSSFKQPQGIIGFNRGILSMPSQIGIKRFSHCFGKYSFSSTKNITSLLKMGDIPMDEDVQFTKIVDNPMDRNFFVLLESISIGNITVNSTDNLRQFNGNGGGGMIVDTGTTQTKLPSEMFKQLTSAMESMVSYERAKDVEESSGFAMCFSAPYPYDMNKGQFPLNISFNFGGNAVLVMPQASFVSPAARPSGNVQVQCLLIMEMPQIGYGPSGVLGNFQMRQNDVIYDLVNNRIGFKAMDCAQDAYMHGF